MFDDEMLFLRVNAHGPVYVDFYLDLKKLRLRFLLIHKREFYFFHRYKNYGIDYLKFLKLCLEKGIREVIDESDLEDGYSMTILHYVYLDLDTWKRRN